MVNRLDRDIVVTARRRAENESIVALAREFDVNYTSLRRAVAGFTWRYLDKQVPPVTLGRGRRALFGSRANPPLLTRDQVIDARRRARGGETAAALARECAVGYEVMHGAITGATWRQLDDVEPPVTLRPNARLTPDDIRALREIAEQRSLKEAAAAYELNVHYARLIVERKAWRHVA